MLIALGIILLIVWIIGVAGVFTIGWFIHLFLIVGIILILIHLFRSGNKAMGGGPVSKL